MASSSLRFAQPTSANGILKTKTNTFFTRRVFPFTQFTNKSLVSNARAITKLTCVNGRTEIATCNHIIGEKTELAPLKIGIIGFGNFGQFIAKGMRRQGHSVLATSRSDYSEYCKQNGIQFFRNMEALCEEQPDVILVCSSILSTENIIRSIPFHKLNPDTIFADVLSVKQFPRNLFIEVLPPRFGIVCTHPMFGPESGKNGWIELPFVFEKVRVSDVGSQAEKCTQFLNIFEQEGCRMVEMSCEEHDRHAAGSQFITHTIGRVLSHLNLESTPINTKGYETLLQLTENSVSDSFDLYYGLFMYNVNATEQMDNLDRAFETVKQKLYGRLHDILRKQIVERVPMQGASKAKSTNPGSYLLPDKTSITQLTSLTIPEMNLSEAVAVSSHR
ncbi:arogenate dehydrogenase 2 [Carex littledalei]|uniref:Arogenate dehydrogenase 2 n=1 Tax=Carex littledalei TaxID=544730 RepID=A0A833R4Y8_9POAL|nr:arogenate dehydrogenase 2 [Carex littledalei]